MVCQFRYVLEDHKHQKYCEIISTSAAFGRYNERDDEGCTLDSVQANIRVSVPKRGCCRTCTSLYLLDESDTQSEKRLAIDYLYQEN